MGPSHPTIAASIAAVTRTMGSGRLGHGTMSKYGLEGAIARKSGGGTRAGAGGIAAAADLV